MGLEIVTQRWDNTSDSRPLQTLFKNSDVLLGLDDPQLYNPKTAKNLLLSSYCRNSCRWSGPTPDSSEPAAWPAPTAISLIGWLSWTNCSTIRLPIGRARFTRNTSKS